MDSDSPVLEKSPFPPGATLSDDDVLAATRTVAFDAHDQGEISEEKVHHGHLRPRGVEMKREMTKEDMELAAAGYEHLEDHRAKTKKGDTADLDKVDIQEHQLAFAELGKTLDTNLDTKDPSCSYGLTAEEAKARLLRDGPNVLTPPKKKSALRKVPTQWVYLPSPIAYEHPISTSTA